MTTKKSDLDGQTNSLIILALLSSGEAYLVDQRKEYRGRTELCDIQEDGDEDNRPR